MPLTKSIPVKAGTPLLMKSTRTDETIFEYNVPDEYNAIIHITVDLFPKPSGLALLGGRKPGETH